MERNQNSLSPSSEYVLQTLSCLLIFYLLTENPFDKSEFPVSGIFSDSVHILCKEVDKMEKQNRKSQILNILAKSVRRVVEEDVPDFDDLQEIRLRAGKPLMVIYRNREMVLPAESGQHITTKEEIRETMEYISHYSLYAYENELKQGFLTVEGGHRVGVSGKVIVEKEKVKNIQYISLSLIHI